MRALVKKEPRKGIWMEEVPVPTLESQDVLIKVDHTAICGTDLHIYQWDAWSAKHLETPRVIGHEFVGKIAKIGDGVQGYCVGERVSAEGHIVCGVCRQCREGRSHHCPHTLGMGLHRNGAFAEFVAVPTKNLWRVPKEIPSHIATFLDPLGNAMHCVSSCHVAGEDVLITGAGPIGMLAVGLCRFLGARRIVISDVNAYRLNLAREMGADMCVNVKETSVQEASKQSNLSLDYTVGLEMSGHPDGLNDLVQNLAHGGQIALLGILPNGAFAPWDQVMFKSLTLKGIYGREMYRTWYQMTRILQRGFDVQKVLTHVLPIADFQEGFDLMEKGLCGKVVCDW